MLRISVDKIVMMKKRHAFNDAAFVWVKGGFDKKG
jgi:hypothetical protein